LDLLGWFKLGDGFAKAKVRVIGQHGNTVLTYGQTRGKKFKKTKNIIENTPNRHLTRMDAVLRSI